MHTKGMAETPKHSIGWHSNHMSGICKKNVNYNNDIWCSPSGYLPNYHITSFLIKSIPQMAVFFIFYVNGRAYITFVNSWIDMICIMKHGTMYDRSYNNLLPK